MFTLFHRTETSNSQFVNHFLVLFRRMLDICSICLRTGIEQQTLEETLYIFYKDLCGIEFDGNYLFCPTCAHLLRKFYNFRNKCHKAYHVLKNWNNESIITRIPVNELYTKLPPTSLGMSKDDNLAMYCYNYSEENTESNSNLNDLNSYCGNNTKFIKQKTKNKTKIKQTEKKCNKKEKGKYKIALQNQLVNDSLILLGLPSVPEEIKTEEHDLSDSNCYDNVILNDDYVIHNDDDVKHNNDYIKYNDDDIKYDDDVVIHNNDNVIYYDDDIKYDDDVVIHNDDQDYHNGINMKEVSNKRKRKRKSDMELTEDEPEKKINKTYPDIMLDIDLEETKRNVKKKLKNGDVRDKDGNVIEVEVIVNNLHKLHKSIYTRVQKSCDGDEPLTPKAIEVLSRIQKLYGTLYSSVFITKHLTTDEEIMQVFRERETNQNYVQSEHKCTRCFKYFKSIKVLDYHIDRFHDPSNPHKCRYCDATFSRRTLLLRHIQSHKVVYQCKLCPLVTNYISVVDSHTSIHTGAKYRCTKCSAVFNSRPPLASHMNSMHAEYFCPYCANKFHTETGLRQHKQQKHRNVPDTVGPPSAKCELCDIQFISDEVYLEHKRKSHSGPPRRGPRRKRTPCTNPRTPKYTCRMNVIDTVGPPSAKCELCDIQFISDEVYLEHKRKSHDGPPKERGPRKKRTPCSNPKTPKYTCRVCKHIEPSMGALTWHFKSEHPDEEFDLCRIALRDTYKYLCHLCGKGFEVMCSFEDHKNVHTGARPYTCTECPKAFFSRRHLRDHLEFHAPPTHQCTHCGKKFHSRSNLNSHKRGHIGNRRYACELCGKTFLHQDALNAHVRGVHQHIRRKKKHTKQTTMNTE